MKISIVIFFFISYASYGQMISIESIDCITNLIDKDTSLEVRNISLDTLYIENGSMIKTEVTFVAYIDLRTNQVRKIVWNHGGEYYDSVTIYYYKSSAIKGLIKARFRRTDTNPQFETNSIVYFKDDKVVEEKELLGNNYRANGFWYLSTVNGFIKLSGLSLKYR